MSTWDPFAPCNDAYNEVEHAPHTYTWTDAVYECRGFPARVVISRQSEVKVPQLHRLVPPPEYQQKESVGHRFMDWLMTLDERQFYILVTAGVMSAGILFFTVVWVWVMF